MLTKEQKMHFSHEQRCFIVKHYFLNQGSYTHNKIAFEEKWRKINQQKTLIHCIIIRFEQQHTVAVLPKNEQPCVQTMEFEQQVLTTLVATSYILSRCLSQHVNASHSSMYCTMCSIAYPLLGPFFGRRLISLGVVSDIMWLLRSPNLSPLDFFLWSFLKNRIYRSASASLDDLKARITEENALIDHKLLKNFFLNLKKRAQLCITNDGEHFQYFL